MSEAFASNRRQFLGAGLSIGATLAAASALSACKGADEIEWNEEIDIVVIGAGGAGLTAAVVALRAGSSVMLLEKAEQVGGSTSLSGGVIQASGTPNQVAAGVVGDTPGDHFAYYEQAGEGVPTPELLHLLTDGSAAAIAFMEELGMPYNSVYGVSPIATVDPELMVDRIHVPGDEVVLGAGSGHVQLLADEVEVLGGDVRFSATVKELIQDELGNIVGVAVDLGGATIHVHALQAVILASGGFDRNVELSRAYSPQQLWELETGICLCAPTNTGDGIVMGMEIGADLAGLGGTIGVPAVTMGTAPLAPGLPVIPGIWVNAQGQRFVDEACHYAYAMRAVFDQQDHMGWAIFDEAVRGLGGEVLGGIWGAWSADLSAEIASGLVKVGDTLTDLANAIGVNGTQLVRTLAVWNQDCVNEVDSVFGKAVGLQAMDAGPYYAVRVTSVNLGSIGGLKIDTDTRVVSLLGQPIPRVYAAGMVAGGFIGPYYPGSGTAILATVVLGRIAGARAAEESRLEPAKKLVEA